MRRGILAKRRESTTAVLPVPSRTEQHDAEVTSYGLQLATEAGYAAERWRILLDGRLCPVLSSVEAAARGHQVGTYRILDGLSLRAGLGLELVRLDVEVDTTRSAGPYGRTLPLHAEQEIEGTNLTVLVGPEYELPLGRLTALAFTLDGVFTLAGLQDEPERWYDDARTLGAQLGVALRFYPWAS